MLVWASWRARGGLGRRCLTTVPHTGRGGAALGAGVQVVIMELAQRRTSFGFKALAAAGGAYALQLGWR